MSLGNESGSLGYQTREFCSLVLSYLLAETKVLFFSERKRLFYLMGLENREGKGKQRKKEICSTALPIVELSPCRWALRAGTCVLVLKGKTVEFTNHSRIKPTEYRVT